MCCLSFLLLAWAGGSWVCAQERPRRWMSTEGTMLEAVLVDADHETVRLRLSGGVISAVPRSRLSVADQEHVAGWLRNRPLVTDLPDLIGVASPDFRVETVVEDAAGGRFVYRTLHFEFDSQGRLAGSLAREVGRTFEATYELLRALPWDIQPRPPEGSYFRASLFRDEESYHRAGGLPGSAGAYYTHWKRFLVPFGSLGIREVGSTYRMDDDFDTHVLVHELTHQMMHFWLGYLPQWVVEGIAEYTGNLPLKNGRFRMSEARDGLKAYLDFRRRRMPGGVPEPYPLERLFALSPDEWSRIMATDPMRTQRLYLTSYLLVYYFMHLDGAGDGARLARYMRASAVPVRRAEAYEAAMAEFKRRPWVKVKPDGSFEYPRDLEPPVLPPDLFFGEAREAGMRETLGVLLDGRTEAVLMDQVRAAYRAHDIRL